MRSVAGAVAVAVVVLGLTAAPAAAEKIDPAVKDVERVAAPKHCGTIPGVSDSEIRIGSIAPLTGAIATSGFFPNVVEGIQARFAFANASGETGNRKLTLVPADDEGVSTQNLSVAQGLVEQQGVYAVLAESPAGAASASYLNQQGVPVVGWPLGLPIYGQFDNYFGFQNANTRDLASEYSGRDAQIIAEVGGKNIAVVGTNAANSSIAVEQVVDAIDRHDKDLAVVYKTADVPVGNTDWQPYVRQIIDSGADTLFSRLSTPENIALLSAMKQAGAPVAHVVLSTGYDRRVAGVAALDGALVGIEFKPLETAPAPKGIADFKAAMAQYRPQATVDQAAAAGWLTGSTLIEGIKAAGATCPTREAFIHNLRLVTNYTADGFFDPVDFQQAFNKPARCAYYVKVDATAGQFVPQFGSQPVCGELIKNKRYATPTPRASATSNTTAAR